MLCATNVSIECGWSDKEKKVFSKERTKRNNTYGNKEEKHTVKCTFQNCSEDAGATSVVVTRDGRK